MIVDALICWGGFVLLMCVFCRSVAAQDALLRSLTKPDAVVFVENDDVEVGGSAWPL